MKVPYQEYNSILLKSKTAGEALRGLFYTAKAHSDQWSLGFLSKKIGLKSKGFLSDLMSQKKRLNPSHVSKFSEALGLNKEQARVFLALAKLDHIGSNEKGSDLKRELEFSKKSLKIQKMTVSSEMKNLLLTLEVYSYINMFAGGVEYKEIRSFFSGFSFEDLNPSLGYLLQANLVKQNSGIYTSTGESFLFSDSENEHSHLDFLKTSLEKAASELDYWFERNKVAHIESSLITVNSKKLVEKMPSVKEKLLDIQNELDDEHPDMILRFNVQITPSKKSKKYRSKQQRSP